MKHRLIFPFLALAFLGGCLNTNPTVDSQRHFVLTAVPASGEETDTPVGLTVGLRRVQLPAYLDHSRIAVRQSANQIEYLEQDVWAGPLNEVLADFLATQIEDDVPGVRVQLPPWNRKGIDFVLSVTYLRSEVSTDGQAVAEAKWTCTDPSDPTHTFTGRARIEKDGPAPSESVESSIQTLSEANRELAAKVSQTIQTVVEKVGAAGGG